jgi:hypothetical protein
MNTKVIDALKQLNFDGAAVADSGRNAGVAKSN